MRRSASRDATKVAEIAAEIGERASRHSCRAGLLSSDANPGRVVALGIVANLGETLSTVVIFTTARKARNP